MTLVHERDVFADRFEQIIERIAEHLAMIPPGDVDTKLLADGNSPAMIAAHVTGALRGAVLGIGCGLDVERHRPSEFAASGGSPDDLAASMRALGTEIGEALRAAPDGRFDELVTPPQSWLGLVPQQEMSRRSAIVSATAHASEHLGELMFIKDSLAARRN